MSYVANFIAFLAVKEFWRYVKFWPTYSYLSVLGQKVVTKI